jgi:hypothetical protein
MRMLLLDPRQIKITSKIKKQPSIYSASVPEQTG